MTEEYWGVAEALWVWSMVGGWRGLVAAVVPRKALRSWQHGMGLFPNWLCSDTVL